MKAELYERETYFHRDYENDMGKPAFDDSPTDQVKRTALVALPFLSLCSQFKFPIALGMSGLRAFNDVKNWSGGPYHYFQTLVSTAGVVATLLGQPLGLGLATVSDLLTEIAHFGQYVRAQEYEKAFDSCGKIVNNALYLACLVGGGLKLTIASLAAQITLCLTLGKKEWNKGHYLEAAGHMGMALARSVQLQPHLTKLQSDMHIQARAPARIDHGDEIDGIYDENDCPIPWSRDV